MTIRTDEDPTIPPSAAEEAGEWDARLRAPNCTDDERASFAVWCDADVTHREAFERLQAIVATLRHERGRADVRALRDEALRNVQHRRHRFWTKAWTRAAAVGFIALTIGVVLWKRPAEDWLSRVDTYSTGIGQRSTLVLEDGSSVELNAQSRINVRFSSSQRHVELAEGQVLFNVAKNQARPFVVDAGNRRIVAVGTQFDVRLDVRSVQVTLIEGKVRVGQGAPGDATVAKDDGIELLPGRQFVAMLPASVQANHRESPSAATLMMSRTLVRDIDVAKVTGWREGRIFLNDVPLDEAVEEMNKHSAVQIRIDSAVLAGVHVNGMFKAGGQESFVAALEEYFPISAQRRSDREIVLTVR